MELRLPGASYSNIHSFNIVSLEDDTFNMDVKQILQKVTSKTKASGKSSRFSLVITDPHRD